MIRRRWRQLVLGAALLPAACGGTTVAPSATTSPIAASIIASPPVIAPPSVAPTSTPTGSPSPTPRPTPNASLPTTGRIELPDHGIAFSLPTGWTRIDLGPEGAAQLDAAGGSKLPRRVLYEVQWLLSHVVRLGDPVFAFSLQPEHVGETLVVWAIPASGGSLDDLEPILIRSLKQRHGTSMAIGVSRGEGPGGGEDLRLTYTVESSAGSFPTIQYVYAGAQTLVSFTCSATAASLTLSEDCASIELSLEILP